MATPSLREEMVLALGSEAETQRFGADLAAALRPGDLVTLRGDLGAGKTTLARALIRALADDPDLDVPSPTFTIAQDYALRLAVLHVDLYRIGSPEELDELGLEEALARGIVLVEWPERAGDFLPRPRIEIELEEAGIGRRLLLHAPGEAMASIRRSLGIRSFLADAGHAHAQRSFLLGDASTRAYEIVREAGHPDRILMDAPRRPDGPPIRDGKPYSQIAHLAESVAPFVAIAGLLRERGLCAPEILAQDLDEGLLLIEHLGSGGFLEGGMPVPERYAAAAELLAHFHARPVPQLIPVAPGLDHRIPFYDRGALNIEVELLVDWYLPFVTGRAVEPALRQDYLDAWAQVFVGLEAAEKHLVIRDYHSPNLIWRPRKQGLDRLGVIDFQDAMIGPSAYDVASLAMDARVDISQQLEQATKAAYVAAREAQGTFDRDGFETAYAIMAAQRNAKILGIFVRLNDRDGKPHYLKHLPRIRDYFSRALIHPALAPVRDFAKHNGLLGEGANAA